MSREIQLHMLLSADERAWLTALAQRDGMTISDYLRQMIRREFTSLLDREFIESPRRNGLEAK